MDLITAMKPYIITQRFLTLTPVSYKSSSNAFYKSKLFTIVYLILTISTFGFDVLYLSQFFTTHGVMLDGESRTNDIATILNNLINCFVINYSKISILCHFKGHIRIFNDIIDIDGQLKGIDYTRLNRFLKFSLIINVGLGIILFVVGRIARILLNYEKNILFSFVGVYLAINFIWSLFDGMTVYTILIIIYAQVSHVEQYNTSETMKIEIYRTKFFSIINDISSLFYYIPLTNSIYAISSGLSVIFRLVRMYIDDELSILHLIKEFTISILIWFLGHIINLFFIIYMDMLIRTKVCQSK